MEFSEKEYIVPFFVENDFFRKKCKKCGKFFWTQDRTVDNCMEAPCCEYTFIHNPPTNRHYTLDELKEAFLKFFERNNHTRIQPYPVIARWRDDLFVTIASIADFQPFVTEGITPPPANPLVISQPCLRFIDIDNVGLTAGRHLTIFEMGGAHAFNYPDIKIYWKDDTVRYHHKFVTNVLGIDTENVSYKEGIWSGGGNAGPCLESCIGGLEVATLVFMQYKVVNDKYVDMPIKIVDTGYGMERFTWLSQGTISGFEAIYGSILDKIMHIAGLVDIDERLLIESVKNSALMDAVTISDRMILRKSVANKLAMDPIELDKIMVPIEGAYGIADHTKALVFMLAEGAVPSNIKIGYLTRLLIRRTYRLLRLLGIENQFLDIVEMQINHWSKSFPHIKDMENEILEALIFEEKKYRDTLKRGMNLSKRIAKEIKSKGKTEIPIKTLIELYDSHGISPEIVRENVKSEGIRLSVPDNFYSLVAQRHTASTISKRKEITVDFELEKEVSNLPKTELLYYDDPYQTEFKAKILKIVNTPASGKCVVLDRTAFYPEGGGQISDSGTFLFDNKQMDVFSVQKIGNIVIHHVKSDYLVQGVEIIGKINWAHRLSLMRHHTSTHIIMGAVRRIVGEHAWQAGAQKEVEKSRLDVSHWKRITPKQLTNIEKMANSQIMTNLPVEVLWMPRDKAVQMYGFRLYQGGVVPGAKIRIVKIGDWDVEACGGTHLRRTGEIGLLKLLQTERIQDGVERITFASGFPALKYVQETEQAFRNVSRILNVPVNDTLKAVKGTSEELKEVRREVDRLKYTLAKFETEAMLRQAKEIFGIKLVLRLIKGADVDYLIKMAGFLVEKEPKAVTVICNVNKTVKIVVMVGEEAVKIKVNAGKIANEVAKIVGGGGSGRADFGQGGGVKVDEASKALKIVEKVVKNQILGSEEEVI